MKNCLVLLTKKYPFDSGEEFIENEVPILARTFQHIVLIATSVADQTKQTRTVPENVEVYALPAAQVRRAVLLRLPAAALFPLSGEVAGTDREQAGKTFRRKLFCSYFLAKANCVYTGCKKLLSGAKLEAYDGVTFYSYWLYDTALAAIKLKRDFGLKNSRVISRAHRYDLYADQNPAGFLPMRETLLQNLDKVYPCSLDGKRYLIKSYPQYSGKIQTAYLGTQDQGLSPDSEGPTFHLVSCCHVSAVKRVDCLARSLALLKSSGLKLKWTHLGGGDGLDAIKDFAKENLSFLEYHLAGEVSNSRLMAFYRENPVDCFVNTSSSEGLPVSIMEAASFGIPILATDVGGTSEIVKPGKNGFLLPPDFSLEELAGKIELFCRMNTEDRHKLRQASRAIWVENFCSKQNYARFAVEITPNRSSQESIRSS